MMIGSLPFSLKAKATKISVQRWTALAVPFLMFSGAAGHFYVLGDYLLEPLLVYVGALSVAVGILTNVRWFGRDDASPTNAPERVAFDDENQHRSLPEDAGLSFATRRVDAAPAQQHPKAPQLRQQEFDFDGIDALRTLDEITGGWLVMEASARVSTLIRQACVQHLDGNDAELARVERWLDISDCLRSPECRAFPKAEIRRRFAAERCGVSKEQVRQIDQGRYGPLNKILKELDPATLACQV